MRDPQGAFDGLCRDVSPRLVGALVLQFGDRGRAEDIAQEALARAWARWREVSRMEHPERWVFTVAYRLAIGSVRRRGSEDRAYARHGAGGSDGDATDADIGTLVVDRIVVAAALRSMTPRQRAAVTLRYYAGFTVAETAAVMGCAGGTVKALTSQGLTRVRSELAHTTTDIPSSTGGEP